MKNTNTDEKSLECPYNYIVVEGVIGVGKTSLCKLIREKLGGMYVLENFESNPFIIDFYKLEVPKEFQ